MNDTDLRYDPQRDHVEGGYVEHITRSDGTQLNDQDVEEIIADVREATRAGRPSLTAPGRHSPTVSLRLSADTADRLAQRAQAEGRRRSDIMRDALNAYLRTA
jgi:hypothetical protein